MCLLPSCSRRNMTTRWTTSLSSIVNLPYAINLRPDLVQIDVLLGAIDFTGGSSIKTPPGPSEALPYTLNPTPYTLHLTPYTLHTTHYTLQTTHYTLNSRPCSTNSIPHTLMVFRADRALCASLHSASLPWNPTPCWIWVDSVRANTLSPIFWGDKCSLQRPKPQGTLIPHAKNLHPEPKILDLFRGAGGSPPLLSSTIQPAPRGHQKHQQLGRSE